MISNGARGRSDCGGYLLLRQADTEHGIDACTGPSVALPWLAMSSSRALMESRMRRSPLLTVSPSMLVATVFIIFRALTGSICVVAAPGKGGEREMTLGISAAVSVVLPEGVEVAGAAGGGSVTLSWFCIEGVV